MMRILQCLLLISLLTISEGCMNLRVVSQYDSADLQPHQVTEWVYFWGLMQPNDSRTDELCESMCIVSAKTNFGYLLIGALSLGMAVPMQVVYECCPYEPPASDI
ncbi:hypothetical protein AB9P05_18100 [Roseivirga sp. BDSF3-8]|uniref:hypothetical protein n=1 Tax=Roseivirga sp. BDSF3-8 TaxID=3241598 RepID=UPI0035325FA7